MHTLIHLYQVESDPSVAIVVSRVKQLCFGVEPLYRIKVLIGGARRSTDDIDEITESAATVVEPGLVKGWCGAPLLLQDVVLFDTFQLLQLAARTETPNHENERVLEVS